MNVALATETGSLNVIPTLALPATSIEPFAGVVLATVGAASAGGGPAVCEPSPSNVSVAKPSHWTAGSNASEPLMSPSVTTALRRSVLSAVLTRPVPHSVPGSKPTWPITSITVVPLRRTTASSPLNQPEPFVWSATARIAALALAWARTKTSSSATVPARLIVNTAVAAVE